MDVKKYYAELESRGHSFEKCRLHYCLDWDDLPLCQCSEEVKRGTCGCNFDQKEQAVIK